MTRARGLFAPSKYAARNLARLSMTTIKTSVLSRKADRSPGLRLRAAFGPKADNEGAAYAGVQKARLGGGSPRFPVSTAATGSWP